MKGRSHDQAKKSRDDEPDLIKTESSTGKLTWQQSLDKATEMGARLPSHKEVQQQLKRHGGHPLFATDTWWPVADAPNVWVYVGGQKKENLGRRHDRIGKGKAQLGYPKWGKTEEYHSFRATLGVVKADAEPWYHGTINGHKVGLLNTVVNGNYMTVPKGAAVTGALVKINGKLTNLVLNSNNDYWCCDDGLTWKKCQEHKGKFDASFVRTNQYATSIFFFNNKKINM